jgi:hypothetical protein
MSLYTLAVDLSTQSKDLIREFKEAGSPQELLAMFRKYSVVDFAGISALDLTSLTAGEVATVRATLVADGMPAEALALLDKIKAVAEAQGTDGDAAGALDGETGYQY